MSQKFGVSLYYVEGSNYIIVNSMSKGNLITKLSTDNWIKDHDDAYYNMSMVKSFFVQEAE